jgi:uncharacterized BrkB/YihY/UPF0761 family membrane protein
MSDWFRRNRRRVRWVVSSSVGLAFGLGFLGLIFTVITHHFNLLPHHTAEMFGLGPVVIFLIFMLGCFLVHGVLENIRSVARVIGWARGRLGR